MVQPREYYVCLSTYLWAFCYGYKDVCPRCCVACSLSAYWLGASPQTFYKYYTCKAVVLYGSRFYLYKSKNWHYYMLEFCYFANILLLLEVWVFPNSPTFHKVIHTLKLTTLHWATCFQIDATYHGKESACMLNLCALHHQKQAGTSATCLC